MRFILRKLLPKIVVFGIGGTSIAMASVASLSATNAVQITNPDVRLTCNFYNYDNTLLYSGKVEPSHDAVYRGTTPIKPADDLYSYEFYDWDKPLYHITENTKFYAQFKSKSLDYKIKFTNYDGTVLHETMIQAGDDAYYPYENPTKPSDEAYSYYFVGWDEPLENIRKDTSFVAQYKKTSKQYSVYYYNYDETLLYTEKVPYGGNSSYKGPTFSGPKAEDGYHYEFSKWSDSTQNITGDKAVIAEFELEKNKYIVTFYNDEEEVLYVDDDVLYKESAVYEGPYPTKQPTDEYAYEFAGWDKSFSEVTENLAVYALFKEVNPDCTIVFKNYDGTVLETHTVKFGSTVVYEGEEPTKPETDACSYKFIGWDRDTTSVNMSFDVYPIFEEILKEFTVTFVNYDETVLDTVTVAYGTDASDAYTGETPERPEDDFYTYEFKEWNEDLTNVTEDLTAVALFDAIPKLPSEEGDEGDQGGGGEGGGGGGGGSGGGGGGESGSDPTPGKPQLAVIKFMSWDDRYLDHDAVFIGRDAKYDGTDDLSRPDGQGHSNYEFCSWSSSIENVQDSNVVYAQYEIHESAFTKYIVTFRNDDGSLIHEAVCYYGDTPVLPEWIVPQPNLKDNRGGVFAGWVLPSGTKTNLLPVTESYTVFASYTVAKPPSGEGHIPGDDDSSGSVSGGGKTDIPDITVGTLTADYSGLIYIRERSFGDYDPTMNEFKDSKPYAIKNKLYSPLYLTSDLIKESGSKVYNTTINWEKAQLRPGAPLYSHTYYPTDGDVSIIGTSALEYTFDFSAFELTKINYNVLKSTAHSSSEYVTLESDYRTFVHNNYLYVTEEESQFLASFVEENHLSVEGIDNILNVKDFIKTNYKYSLDTDVYPEGSDYVLHFLSEDGGEGICNNFASALTLLYRYMGLPARFVTGYVAYSHKNQEARISTSGAHAWTEIYLDGIGWVSVDGTGSADPGETDWHDLIPDDPGDQVNPYNPFGPLKGPAQLTLTVSPVLSTKEYDGLEMGVTGTITDGSFLNPGDYVDWRFELCEQGKDVGAYVTRAMPRIYNSSNVDVTEDYVGIVKLVYESFTITKHTIEVTTGSATKPYDGAPLTCGSATITGGALIYGDNLEVLEYSGSITNPGEVENIATSYRILNSDQEDVTKNYLIIWHYGTLTVE